MLLKVKRGLSLATACANSVSGQWLMRSIRWGPAWDDSEAWGGTWPRHIPGARPEARTAVPARALIFESLLAEESEAGAHTLRSPVVWPPCSL